MSARAPELGIPRTTIADLGLPAVRGAEDHVHRFATQRLSPEARAWLEGRARHLGVTDEFVRVVTHFATPSGHTPAGFRVELTLDADGVLRADLVRDIGREADGVPRPTRLLFSADTANPHELAPVASLIANLTCNPGIIYDLFINNPKANPNREFTTRDQVMTEIGRILGPGADISVELNNPFEPDFARILDEVEQLRDILSPWRLVIKVPHTGPVNAGNVGQLLTGNRKLDRRWFEPATADSYAGHTLALRLREHGYRVNFTLMFEPHQIQLALQARPTFVNSFVRHRLVQSARIAALLARHDQTHDDQVLAELRDYLVDIDQLAATDTDFDLHQARDRGMTMLAYRRFTTPEGSDGLDTARHNLRVLRQANLPDTRLIVCSMEGDTMYPDIDRMLMEREFADMVDRVVVTAEPGYLARFASAGQVVSYQRRFMQAAQGQT